MEHSSPKATQSLPLETKHGNTITDLASSICDRTCETPSSRGHLLREKPHLAIYADHFKRRRTGLHHTTPGVISPNSNPCQSYHPGQARVRSDRHTCRTFYSTTDTLGGEPPPREWQVSPFLYSNQKQAAKEKQ